MARREVPWNQQLAFDYQGRNVRRCQELGVAKKGVTENGLAGD
jgi:hypothetical protein